MEVLQSLGDLPRDGLGNRLPAVVSLALQPIGQGAVLAQLSHNVDGVLGFYRLLVSRNARVLHHLQNIYLIFEISSPVFVGQRALLVRFDCELFAVSIACDSDDGIRSSS